jgi:Nucleotidyl transferase AbiEii toxin, Type IV TA system
MVALGALNSRLKDIFDVAILSGHLSFEGPDLAAAIVATFERRRTNLPETFPPILEERSARNAERVAQWRAFLRRIRVSPDEHDFESEAAKVRAFAGPALEAARLGRPWSRSWPAGGPWVESS